MTFLADRVTNVPTSFRQLRMKDAEGALQEGVVGANDLKIVQRAAGANMSVDFSVGAGYIQIDSGTRSGLAHFYNDVVANVAVTASNATNPRVDFAIVRYNDSSIPAGTGGNTPTPEVLAGTPTATAQATNPAGAGYLLGAPTMPNDALLLAAFTVPATSTSVVTANILDRRKWARGALSEIVYTGTTTQTVPATFGVIPVISAGIQQRVECSGVPLIIELDVSEVTTPATASMIRVNPVVDGAVPTAITGTPGSGGVIASTSAAIAVSASPTKRWRYTPPAGSHLFTIWGVGPAGNILAANPTNPLRLTIWEDVRPVANNGTA